MSKDEGNILEQGSFQQVPTDKATGPFHAKMVALGGKMQK